MRCIVTAGPTYEPLDQVRRLTNSSTGRLGSELATHLIACGHEVTLLLGEQATCHGEQRAGRIISFGTTLSLSEALQSLAGPSVDAVFHAAAVSDFAFGKIWARPAEGELQEVRAGKIPTRHAKLLAELVPTPKVIAQLRDWFPLAVLVGWKYEVDGNRADVISLAEKQMTDCRTTACVANGPAYGPGFGLVTPGRACAHLAEPSLLYAALEKLLHLPRHET